MAVIPFIKLSDIERKTDGKYTVDDVLALASIREVSLCVHLDSGDRIRSVPASFDDIFYSKNEFAEVSGNVNGGKGKGLFRIVDNEVFSKLLHGKNDILDIFHEVRIWLYGEEPLGYMGLPEEYFGANPLSKLVMPQAELERLLNDAVKPAVSGKQDVDGVTYWSDKESMEIIIQDLCEDLSEPESEYLKPTREECLKSIKILAEKAGAFMNSSGRMNYGQVNKIVQGRGRTKIQEIIKEAFKKYG